MPHISTTRQLFRAVRTITSFSILDFDEDAAGAIEMSVKVIENALLLAAARRLLRPTDAPPLGTIRSLAYFLPAIDEVIGLKC